MLTSPTSSGFVTSEIRWPFALLTRDWQIYMIESYEIKFLTNIFCKKCLKVIDRIFLLTLAIPTTILPTQFTSGWKLARQISSVLQLWHVSPSWQVKCHSFTYLDLQFQLHWPLNDKHLANTNAKLVNMVPSTLLQMSKLNERERERERETNQLHGDEERCPPV